MNSQQFTLIASVGLNAVDSLCFATPTSDFQPSAPTLSKSIVPKGRVGSSPTFGTQ
jgi:hypothetical protein